MTHFLSTLGILFAKAIAIPTVFVLGVAGYHFQQQAGPMVGATVPIATSFYNDSLQSGITPSATAFTLVSGKDSQGNSLSGTYGFVIDQGSASQEIVYCTTVSGTSVSGCVRGVDLTTGTTSVATLEQTHNRGAPVQITTAPVVNIIANILRGVESIAQPIFYASTVATTTLVSNPNNIVNVSLLNSTAISGAPNSSETVNGIAQLSTGLQAGSSTSIGSTGARLVLPASLATDTPNTATRGSRVLMSGITGFLSKAWLDFTGLWTFTGGLTSTATTTLAGSNVNSNGIVINTVPYAFPSSQGAAGTKLQDDGNGNLTWGSSVPHYSFATTTTMLTVSNTSAPTYATTTTLMTILGNTLSASSTISMMGRMRSTDNGSNNTACTVLLSTSSGAILMQIAGSNPSGTSGSANSTIFSGMAFNKTVSSQAYQVNQTSIANSTGGLGGSGTSVSTDVSAVDFSQTQSLVLVLELDNANASAPTCNLDQTQITVNP